MKKFHSSCTYSMYKGKVFHIKRNELYASCSTHSFDIISNMLVKISNLSVAMNSTLCVCAVYYLNSLEYLHSFVKFYPFSKFHKIKLNCVCVCVSVCAFFLRNGKKASVSILVILDKKHQTVSMCSSILFE